MTIFQTLPYREAYRAVFGRGKRFFDLSIGGGEAGGAQIWLQTRGVLAKRLEFWAQGIADCGGINLENPDCARELWASIESTAARFHGAHLAQLSADSPLVELARQSGWTVQSAEVCPSLALPPTFEDYVQSLGKNMREQIKRYPKRLEKEFSPSGARRVRHTCSWPSDFWMSNTGRA